MTEQECREAFIDMFPCEAQLLDGGGWDEALGRLSYIPVAYTRDSLDYQAAYMHCFSKDVWDLSVVLMQQGKPVGVWPLTLLCAQDGVWRFRCNQRPVLPPLFIDGFSERLAKKYARGCLEAMVSLRERLLQAGYCVEDNWEGEHFLLPAMRTDSCVQWYRKCMENGARTKLQNDLYVDLSLSEKKYHASIRKRYRSLIHEADHLWESAVLSRVTDGEFDEYRLLHQKVAGRITRSMKSWEIQRDAINRGSAFLVTLRQQNRLIGGGYFSVTRDEGLYGVGAYDRSLFDRPVSHLVQWLAIRHMRELGIRWYFIGRRSYPADVPSPTEKELSISYFKEGFATHLEMSVVTKTQF